MLGEGPLRRLLKLELGKISQGYAVEQKSLEELLKEVERRGIKRFKVIGLVMDLPGFDLKETLKMLEAELEG